MSQVGQAFSIFAPPSTCEAKKTKIKIEPPFSRLVLRVPLKLAGCSADTSSCVISTCCRLPQMIHTSSPPPPPGSPRKSRENVAPHHYLHYTVRLERRHDHVSHPTRTGGVRPKFRNKSDYSVVFIFRSPVRGWLSRVQVMSFCSPSSSRGDGKKISGCGTFFFCFLFLLFFRCPT